MQCILALALIVLFQIEIKIYKDVVKTQVLPLQSQYAISSYYIL